jgi:aminopeptidase N
MKLKLNKPILPNTSVTFQINFETYFDDGGNQRRRMKMFKDPQGNKQYDGVHWYPRICVYDRKFGWETDQHLGKEFYGDFGQFDINLTLPSHYIVDATGELQNEAEVLPAELRAKLELSNFKDKPYGEAASVIIAPDGNTKTWRFRAVNTHDFAWTADPTYRIGEYVLPMPGNPRGKVRCIALAQEPHAAGWQDAAKFNALIIQTYSKDFGIYAYPKMIVADARDGMEYPMLTLDNGRSPGYYGLFAHEIGHNWFFGMVGNNETYRASLDEGFTQFLTHWSMSRLRGETRVNRNSYPGKHYIPMSSLDQTVMYGYLRDAILHLDMPLNTHSDDFNGALHHGGGYGHVYYKTATMLYNLQYVLGDSLFLAAMQHYFNQWKMAHPYFEDFRNSIIQFTHVDLNWFFDQWMETTKTIDYGIANTKKINKDTLAITFKRKGEMQMPIDFTITYQNNTTQHFYIPNTWFNKQTAATVLPKWTGWGLLNPTHTVMVPVKGKVKNIEIDPSKRLADVNLLNNTSKAPILFSFDHQISSPPNRHQYLLKWRPDLWYNNYDGFKIGVHVNGNYLNLKHRFSFTTWYNSGLANNRFTEQYQRASGIDILHYQFSYKHRIDKFEEVFVQSRFLDGLNLQRIGWENTIGKSTFRIAAKFMKRHQIYYLAGSQKFYEIKDMHPLVFLEYQPNISSENNWVNSLQLDYERLYQLGASNGKFSMAVKTAAPFSKYHFSGIQGTLVQTANLHKLELKGRLYASYIYGDNVPGEFLLNLAGASTEELLENKFTRAAGIIPEPWMTYSATGNHFQLGGGLNLRGFAGYVNMITHENVKYSMFNGNYGGAINVEVDFDRYLEFLQISSLNRFIHIDSYLFADAGILGAYLKDIGATVPEFKLQTNILADAGAGIALTIKKWGMLDDPKPLTIRLDVPYYRSITLPGETQNTAFRWVLGVGRCF